MDEALPHLVGKVAAEFDGVVSQLQLTLMTHVILAPYNAQVMIIRCERDYVVSQLQETHAYHARELLDVEITIIGSFVGKDRRSVTVDTVGAIGHLFKYGRTVVALRVRP